MLERRFYPLFLASFILSAGYGSIFTLLAAIRDTFELTTAEVGVIGAAGFLAGFFAQVTLSRYADRGYTRVMLQFGLAFAVLGNVGMIFAADLTSLIASRALLGLGAGSFAPAVRRLVILSDPERAGERLGLMAAFDMAGFCFGPVLASVLFQAFGLRATFVALAAVLLVLAWPVFRVPVPTARSEGAGGAPLRLLLGLPSVRGVLLCSLAFYVTVGVFEAIWAVFLIDRGASQIFVGVTLSVFSLPMMIVPPFSGRLAQRVGPLKVAAGGIGVAIPCMLIYGWLGSLIGLAVLVFVHSVADAFTMPSLHLGIARASPAEHMASGQGLIGASGQLTAAIAALVSGWIYGGWGAMTLFGGSAALMVVLLGFGLWQGASLMHPAPAQEG